MNIDGALIRRFWLKVSIVDGDGCWLCAASPDSHGYPQFTVGSRKNQINIRAHRLSWRIHFGPIPPGLCVLHHCDVRPCVRPNHLFLGTNADNTADMIAKGRERIRGDDSGKAKLTTLDIKRIFALHAAGHKQADIACEFGVSRPQISRIVNRKRWQHLEVIGQ
jgi:hypothetical protein